MKISPTSPPPPPVAPSKDHVGNAEKEEAAFISTPAVDIPSRSGSEGATSDEVVSRFVASCPGGSLMNMAKIPTEIPVAKGASVFAEVNFYFLLLFLFFLLAGTDSLFFLQGFKFALAMEKQLLTLKEAYIGLQAKLEDDEVVCVLNKMIFKCVRLENRFFIA